ncbi:MAG: XRE family transcriptional regulator [Verrucomicrobia bacterium]|jgi:transcriptional regulator with XRE-family HTH domain|nr:XRE family transcriptional regulator [Verrucomicrobiota bacterium]MBT7702018.1 XRE family transcriptional regulator [Verrucomicrobiota bacterium]
MSKPFKNLLNNMSPERRERIKIKTDVLKNEMALGELRQALDLTQEELAKSLHLKQAAISKFEHQSDIYLSTLRKILFAMGADLKIIAHFPDGDVLVNQFTDIRRDSDSNRKLAVS